MDEENISLPELLSLFEKENKKVMNLAQRLSELHGEIAQAKTDIAAITERER